MNAKEYFEKYDPLIWNREDPEKKFVKELVLEMLADVSNLCKVRKAVKLDSVISIIKEVNGKWNVVAAKFKKKYEMDVLKLDVILYYFKKECPGFELYLDGSE